MSGTAGDVGAQRPAHRDEVGDFHLVGRRAEVMIVSSSAATGDERSLCRSLCCGTGSRAGSADQGARDRTSRRGAYRTAASHCALPHGGGAAVRRSLWGSGLRRTT
ncbi:hypothetical protein QJS66_20220 [Kocuria rhizophila]|nr:hypothetical protein QJS66_20220 [Kocuria rhizophila]